MEWGKSEASSELSLDECRCALITAIFVFFEYCSMMLLGIFAAFEHH